MCCITSKQSTYHILSQNQYLSSHIPLTYPLSEENLEFMLLSFPILYLKPDSSRCGKGIIRIDQYNNEKYLLRCGEISESFSLRKEDLWNQINQYKRDRFYLIQQGIDCTVKNHYLFDIHVHLIKIYDQWKLSGTIARIIDNHHILTHPKCNLFSKKLNRFFSEDLQLDRSTSQQLNNKINTISLESVNTISKVYPAWREFGLDLGLDPQYNIWIFEMNISPNISCFKFYDKKTYHRILRLRQEIHRWNK